MTILAFLVVTFGLGTAGLLTRRRPPVSIAVGFVGLVAAVISALLISSGDRLVVGSSALVATDFMRLFVVFGSVAALVLCAMARVEGWQRNLPSAMLLGLGALALGLGLADPVAGLAATAAAGLPGVLVAITTPVDVRGVKAAERELRAVAVTGALAIVAAALVSGPAGLVNLPVTIVGLAYLAMALAVAVRIGAIPFHSRVARVTGSAPIAALPLLLALAPAGFASAALVWVDGNIATTAIPLESQRIVIVAVGLLCILLGIVAATIQDDIEHVVGYSVIQDAGFVMLALAIFDIAAWQPARAWLLIYIVTKSAFAGWALAMRTSFGTSRIAELSGWIRRAPLMAVTLLGIVAATVGVPGLLVFDVRSQLADLSLGSPLALLAIAGGFGSLLYYGRLAKVGLGPVAPLVAAYPGIRPHGPGWVRANVPDAGEAETGAGDSGMVAGWDDAETPAATTGRAPMPPPPARPAPGPTPVQATAATAAASTDAGMQAEAAETAPAAEGAASGPGVETAGSAAPAAPPTPAVPPAPAAAAGTAAASAGTPSSRGPSLDALRRDPKELTQAWAREALERAGLAPSSSSSSTGEEPATAGAPRTPPRSTGIHVIPPVADVRSPGDPWTAAAEAASAAGAEAASAAGGSPAADDGDRAADATDAVGPAVAAGARGGGAAEVKPAEPPAERPAPPARGRPARERRRPATAARSGAGRTEPVRPRDLWEANRLLIVAVLALALSAMGVAAAVGAFGIADAARAAAPASGGGVELGPVPAGPGQAEPGDIAGPTVPQGSAGPDVSAPATSEPGASPATDASPGAEVPAGSEEPAGATPDGAGGSEATTAP